MDNVTKHSRPHKLLEKIDNEKKKKRPKFFTKVLSTVSMLMLSANMLVTEDVLAQTLQESNAEGIETYEKYMKVQNKQIPREEWVLGHSRRAIDCNAVIMDDTKLIYETHTGIESNTADEIVIYNKLPQTKDGVMDEGGDYVGLKKSLKRIQKPEGNKHTFNWVATRNVEQSKGHKEFLRQYGIERSQNHFPRFAVQEEDGILFTGYLYRVESTYEHDHQVGFDGGVGLDTEMEEWDEKNCKPRKFQYFSDDDIKNGVPSRVKCDRKTHEVLSKKEYDANPLRGYDCAPEDRPWKYEKVTKKNLKGVNQELYVYDILNGSSGHYELQASHRVLFKGILTADIPMIKEGGKYSSSGDIAMTVDWKMYRISPDQPTMMEAKVVSSKSQGSHFRKKGLTSWVELNKSPEEIAKQIKQLKGTPKGNTFTWGKVDKFTTPKDVEVKSKLKTEEVVDVDNPPNTLTIGGYYNYTNHWYWVCGLTSCWKVPDWDYEQRYLFHKTIPIALDFQKFYEYDVLSEVNEAKTHPYVKGKVEGTHFQIGERFVIDTTSFYDATHKGNILTADKARKQGIKVTEYLETVLLDGERDENGTIKDRHNLYTQTTLPIKPKGLSYSSAVPFGTAQKLDKAEVKEGMFGFYHPKDVDEAMKSHTKNDITKFGDERVNKDELEQIERANSKGDFMIPFAQVTKASNKATFETDYTSVSKNTGFATIFERFKDVRANYAANKPPLPNTKHLSEMVAEHKTEFTKFGKEKFKDKVMYSEITTPEKGIKYDREKLMRYYTPLEDDTTVTVVDTKKGGEVEEHEHYVHLYDIGLNHGGIGYTQYYTVGTYLTGIDGGENGGYLITQTESVPTSTANLPFQKSFKISASEKASLASKNDEFTNKIFGIRVTKRDFTAR